MAARGLSTSIVDPVQLSQGTVVPSIYIIGIAMAMADLYRILERGVPDRGAQRESVTNFYFKGRVMLKTWCYSKSL